MKMSTLRSVGLTGHMHGQIAEHVLRDDGQEDLTFAVWMPSRGTRRQTALLRTLVLPRDGDRHVHGNASFENDYFMRAARDARAAGGGVALIHSHPRGHGWQGLSRPDAETEERYASRARAITGHPLVGLTMAGDESISARFWERSGRGQYTCCPCANVRTVGEGLSVTWNDALVPPPPATTRQVRTISAWGEEAQQNWSRLRIGIVGAGTVGALVAETLSRMGATDLVLIDHDTVEELNLDRLVHASERDALLYRSKTETLASGLRRSATADEARIASVEYSVVEASGFEAALDCDVLFSCVDRPWPRAVLNLAAYAHLIPVIDAGVRVSRTPRGRLRNAIWRAHVAGPRRQCLACYGQYDPGQVTVERDGSLDDPEYISRLPEDSPLRARQNVFAFALGASSLAINQFISLVFTPGGRGDVGSLRYQLNLAQLDRERAACFAHCPYPRATARGDSAHREFQPTGTHPAAELARASRKKAGGRLRIKIGRCLDALESRGSYLLDRLLRGAPSPREHGA
jgi:hypothetical protein